MMEIDDETCNEIFLLAKKVMNVLKEVYNAESVYLCTMCDGPMNHLRNRINFQEVINRYRRRSYG